MRWTMEMERLAERFSLSTQLNWKQHRRWQLRVEDLISLSRSRGKPRDRSRSR